jgi:hypothetical protein
MDLKILLKDVTVSVEKMANILDKQEAIELLQSQSHKLTLLQSHSHKLTNQNVLGL